MTDRERWARLTPDEKYAAGLKRREYQREWRRKNLEKVRGYQKKCKRRRKAGLTQPFAYVRRVERVPVHRGIQLPYHTLYKWRKVHGFTIEQIEEYLRTHKWECQICGSGKKIRLDHDHQTNRFRGLLCHHCNAGVGFFRDSPELLMATIKYLS